MTLQEIKDRVDELIQLYPDIKNVETLVKLDYSFETNSKVKEINIDKCCNPVIIID